uniref:SWIB domain-containing protein n=1 Tax=Rhodosorus marinus TaxID=101924 RepID=A0A7S0BIG8_9RHOD|mmetsp:Transcript_16642/g.24006  ORF Transcript_16642/g.24006 Transcript_16642/m.24006 type:complete len:108 (+) Transcript_16642:124-447(+)
MNSVLSKVSRVASPAYSGHVRNLARGADKSGSAFYKTYELKPEMASFLGQSSMTSQAALKALYDYINANGLRNGKTITCDSKLKAVSGKTEMTPPDVMKMMWQNLVR